MDFKAGIYNANGSGITGSTNLKLKIKRDADDLFYDFNGGIFKASGHSVIAATMTDVNITNVPGEYEYTVDVSTWNDGVYTCYFQYNGANAFTDAKEFRIHDGKEAEATIPDLSLDTINEIRDAITSKIIDGTVDVEECLKILLAVLAGNIEKNSNIYTFKDQAGTVKLTEVVTQAAVSRTITL